MKEQRNSSQGLAVRTGVTAGYWTCTGVRGKADRRGIFWNPKMSACYKPKYAPIFGAPVPLEDQGGLGVSNDDD